MPDFHSQSRQPRHVDPFAPPPGEGDGMQGNRPAAGARQVGPGQVLSSAFQGSATAGDFLGLDLEVSEPGAADAPGGLELAGVSPYGAAAPSAASDVRQAPRAMPQPRMDGLDDEPYLADDPETFLPDEAPGKRSVGPQVVVAFVLGLAAVAALVLGPKFLKKDPAPAVGSGTPVASLPDRPTAGDPAGTAAGVAPAGATQPAPGQPAGYEGADDDLAGDDLVADAAALLGGPTTPTGGREPSAGGAEDTSSIGDLLRRFTAPDAGEGAPTVSQLPGPGLDRPITGTTFDASLFDPETWMSGELVDMVWRDSAVPIEAIAHPVRVMTPRVGPVRVHLDSGEVFEGRLYAVGQNRVWLEGDMGRLGLDGEHVVEFEHLDPVQVQTETFDSTSIGTGRRVRVQVPGGVLYGRVLSVVDTRVTLITDAGARVTLESPEIEPLGPSRAILVER